MAEDAALVLSIDASAGFATAAEAALSISGERAWASDSPGRSVQHGSGSHYSNGGCRSWPRAACTCWGLSVCEPEYDEDDEAVQALAALAAGGEGRGRGGFGCAPRECRGHLDPLGSDTQLFAPGAWALVRALVNDEHGVSARSATRGADPRRIPYLAARWRTRLWASWRRIPRPS